MMPRRAVAAAAAALLLTATLGVTGCMPEPEPTPTPTGFASEAEAFAAAEETYRAYVDALNQVDLSDPDTFEPVFAWTTGEANAAARESFSQMHADGWTVGGQSTPTVVAPLDPVPGIEEIDVAVCVDVSSVTLVNASGASVVAPDRRDVQSMRFNLVAGETPTGWIIERISGRDGEPECV
ncbi:hypothetical protein ACFVR6_12640 [Microbacterium sp. NPDC058021]|uniref:hypothetical protein n=1 Tax=Microbacterium sp. NPDC058021 TaxID=3346306 RepID=UPI0036DB3E0E